MLNEEMMMKCTMTLAAACILIAASMFMHGMPHVASEALLPQPEEDSRELQLDSSVQAALIVFPE
ncbi:hypothetical protein [Paenibacillus sp. LHD-38]|uniref:hypothetical protein n=1 Tax=Paenibacillus sp. LHD-38 TaxID=3072143 RepID=UPI00280F16E5|nr:hypothetical protein [Paenibacillus sp. LHD-38]MDQ8738377.1 hypothetical protein [Paenibacillus sp. LHD-38]